MGCPKPLVALQFTQDEAYLKNTIYPIMKEAAQFGTLISGRQNTRKSNDETSPYHGENRLVAAPSFSEEQGPTAMEQLTTNLLYGNYITNVSRQAKSSEKMKLFCNLGKKRCKNLIRLKSTLQTELKNGTKETRVGQGNRT